MKKRRFLEWLLMTGLLLACSLPGFETATDTAPTLIVVPNTGEETTTPIGTAVATALAPPSVLPVTAAPVIVATPTAPMVTPNAVNVSFRSGPDLAYGSVSVLTFGSSTTVAGPYRPTWSAARPIP